LIPDLDPKKQEFVMLHILTRIIKNEMKGLFNKHHTSMINDAISVAEHYQTLIEIKSIIDANLRILDGQDGSEIIASQLAITANKYYPNSNEIENIISMIPNISLQHFREYFNEIELIELNRRDQEIDERIILHEGESEFSQEVEYFEPRVGIRGLSYIVTGGSRISRGLTLEGLTISFFLRRAEEPNYDTMLQMARWCGYREKYDDLVRIITTPRIYSDYGLINEAETNMRRQIDLMDENTDPVRHIVWIQEQQGLAISGKMPLSDFLTRIMDYQRIMQGELWTTAPPELYGAGDCNFTGFFDFFAQIRALFNSTVKAHKLAMDVDSYFVREFLTRYRLNIENTQLSASISQIITDLSEFPKWNVSIAYPSSEGTKSYFNQNLSHNFKMVKRTPNSRNVIQRVYSNYKESTSIDLQKNDQGVLEQRTKPLIVFYLADNTIRNSDGQDIFPNCNYPIPLFGIIMPTTSTVIESRQYVRGHREHNVRRPNFGGRNNE